MKKYTVHVGEDMDNNLRQVAAQVNTSVEKLIISILSRFVVSEHILEGEQVKNAYEECGKINLEWANL